MPEGPVPPQDFFGHTAGLERVEVDPAVKRFFLETEQLRAELVQKQEELKEFQEAIAHREVIEGKLAPTIELCYACKGSGYGQPRTRPGHFGPPRPICVHCQGSGFRKKKSSKQ